MKLPGTQFHPLRVQGRKLAAEILAAAQAAVQSRGDGSVTDRALAKRWALASHRAIGAFFDAGSGHAMTLGDLLALPRDLARETLVRALVALDEALGPGTRDTLDAIGIQLGVALDAYRRDLADGAEDDHATHARNLARIMCLAARGYLASQRKAGGQ